MDILPEKRKGAFKIRGAVLEKMILPSSVKFVDQNLKSSFEKLRESEDSLYRFLMRAFEDIEKNAFCGIQIPKRLIPKEYLKRYNVKNLWKYNLPDAWRLIYSIERGGHHRGIDYPRMDGS